VLFFNRILVFFVGLLPRKIVFFFAKRYIAGVNLQDAVDYVKKLNEKGILATMDVLGESITNKEEAQQAAREAMQVFDAIEKHNLNANLSIKPTQFGIMIDEDFCYNEVEKLVKRAKEMNNFVRLDMEDSTTTDRIIKLYRRLRADYTNVGIVVQAYLKRTLDDVIELNRIDTSYRLCKGIYIEPKEIAYKGRKEVRDNFVNILDEMLRNSRYVGIATHDKSLIDESYRIIEERKVPKEKYEFQMLLGVKEDLRDKINADGHKIRIYVPFGKQWYAYSIRRLKENPNMAWQIAKSIITFGK
jgi:proline dehydrogenase